MGLVLWSKKEHNLRSNFITMCPKASPSSLNKIGSEGFALIENGRCRRNQVPPTEVPIIVNSNNLPGAPFGGANSDNNEKPKPPRRNWSGRSLVPLNTVACSQRK
ncbi:unnamed protein product [Sphenostylis stenocarpa]|uniref:Uncharacterized protein n=1 Tax=Sphenostylis stenocarpa TaxID=92480 RepID=A0AA86SKI0_9FABA|nr:unnamed protein product [Sphenostylis stenocarpa]